MLDSVLANTLQQDIEAHKRPFPHLQKQAWDKGMDLPWPLAKTQRFRHLALGDLCNADMCCTCDSVANIEFTQYRLTECPYYIAFVDGRCVDMQLPEKLYAAEYNEAKKTYGMYLENALQRRIHQEQDPLCLQNLALQTEGLFVAIPARLEIKAPIQILQVYTQSARYMAPGLMMHLGKGSKISCVQTHHVVEGAADSVINGLYDIQLEEKAELSYIQYAKGTDAHWVFDTLRIQQKKQSITECLTFDNGDKARSQNICVQLLEEEAETKVQSLHVVSGKRTSYQTIRIEHKAPHCISHQHVKTLLDDRGISNFTGQIFVAPEAQKTDSYQMSQTMLLSDMAKGFSEPQLEIFADDVKASHGSTFTGCNSEELYYLRARGISESAAQKLLVQGFCRELTQSLAISSLQDRINADYGLL